MLIPAGTMLLTRGPNSVQEDSVDGFWYGSARINLEYKIGALRLIGQAEEVGRHALAFPSPRIPHYTDQQYFFISTLKRIKY